MACRLDLTLMASIHKTISSKGRCLLNTSCGGMVLTKSPSGSKFAYKMYPTHKFRKSNYIPVKSLYDLLQLLKELKWIVNGIR